MAKKAERYQILELRVSNVKCLEEVTIHFDAESVHMIRGASGQGKTAILNAIEGGIKGLDPAMVRRGADKATIEIDFDKISVRRVVHGNGKSRLVAKDNKGNDLTQGFLNTIFNASVFDPLAWVTLAKGPRLGDTERRRRQRQELLAALSKPGMLSLKTAESWVANLGEDAQDIFYDVLEHEPEVAWAEDEGVGICVRLHDYFYERRAGMNRSVARLQSDRQHLEEPCFADDVARPTTITEGLKRCVLAEMSVDVSTKNYAQMKVDQAAAVRDREEVKDVEEKKAELFDGPAPDREMVESDAETTAEFIADREKEIGEMEERLRKERGRLAGLRSDKEGFDETISKYRQWDIYAAQAEKIHTRLDEAVTDEAVAKEEATLRLAQKEAKDFQDALAILKLDDALEKDVAQAEASEVLVAFFRDQAPGELLKAAEFPVKGLSFDGDTILLDKIPLGQHGTSESLRVGIAAEIAKSPSTGFQLIDRCESMSSEDLLGAARVAEEYGVRLICTVTDANARPGPGVTVMEKGRKVKDGETTEA